jgi:hypothetical protein
MTARDTDRLLTLQVEKRLGVTLPETDARTLRRAAKTLTRWAELECGDGNEYASWAIERDDDTGLPFMVRYVHKLSGPDSVKRRRIPDREAGALKRVADVCARNGLHFHHQTDPRGCPLYLATEPMTGSHYTNGMGVEG